MELTEFKKDFIENIKSKAAASGDGTVVSFVNEVLTDLLELEIIPDYYDCFHSSKYLRKNYRVDAYSYDEFDFSLSLFIADFSGEDQEISITKSEALNLFDQVRTFIDGCLKGNLIHNLEISRPIYDLASKIIETKEVLRKFKIYILTDKRISSNILSFDSDVIGDKTVEYNIWDISRLQRIRQQDGSDQNIIIELTSIMNNGLGLPCLEASDVSDDDIQCYLCVIPGVTLADLYDKYGSRLLEGNIRSFLSTRGAINKNIRKTIISSGGENKKMFFSYNNGISATASDIKIEESSGGKFITEINNLQIVNGGQTTASLSNARFKDKADLDGIFVQMKLTVIHDQEQSHVLIPNISKYSNSQNKVSTADLVSNNDFNIRMEQISRRIYAPAINGFQFETHWFYERTRGQYENAQSKMTAGEKKKFLLQNPKDQKITKTDFAKYQNSWNFLPYCVSAGAQKNFIKFAENVENVWAKDNSEFNEVYFKKTVAMAIMFKYLDKYIPQQDWYLQGYKANIVTYSLACFNYLIQKQFDKKQLDLLSIWQQQKISECVSKNLEHIAEFVFDHITDANRQIQNVTEWCKKEQCWKLLVSKEFSLTADLEDNLIELDDVISEKKQGKKDQNEVIKIEAQSYVVTKGDVYWRELLNWGSSRNLLLYSEKGILGSALNIKYGKIPSEKQCIAILKIEHKLKEEGFSES